MSLAVSRQVGGRARLLARPGDLMLPFLALHLIFPAMWLISLVRHGPVPNDWLLFKTVADHFVAGDWSRLYTVGDQALHPGYPWRYPPFALYVVAPLAWLPHIWAYAVLAGVQVAALAISIWLLQGLTRIRHGRAEWVLAIALSAPALTTVFTGQSSALMLLCIVSAARLWTRGKLVLACAVLGLLAVKPNWGAVFGLLVLVRGEWKGAAAMAGVAALLCLLTLPLGREIWADFLGASGSAFSLAGETPVKQITLRMFLEATLGRSELTTVLWSLGAAGMVVLAAITWRAPGTPLMHLSMAALLIVAANPYVFFYDGLVLAVPATVWWTERQRWDRGPWLVTGALLASIWCSEQWSYTWGLLSASVGGPLWRLPLSLVGPAATVWLVIAAQQKWHSRTVHPAEVV